MTLAGMSTWQDAIGNVHGELRGANASSSALVLGSHYDTVKDAGAFDGSLGIITAIAAVKALVATSPQCEPVATASLPDAPLSRGNTAAPAWPASSILSLLTRVATRAPSGVATGATEELGGAVKESVALRDVSPCVAAFLAGAGRNVNVRVVAFTDEEGVRFQSTFLGSRALAGMHAADDATLNFFLRAWRARADVSTLQLHNLRSGKDPESHSPRLHERGQCWS